MNPDFMRRKDPFIIAEIGGNHEGDIEYAKKLLIESAEAGVHAVKFQTYTGDKIVSPVESKTRNEHFKKFELKEQDWMSLVELAKQKRVEFMSSVWDKDSFEMLDPYIKIHKIGSGDLTNSPLLKFIAETKKPLIISTAMANVEEIKQAVDFIKKFNPCIVEENNLCIMHCVAMYGDPKDEYANLNSIRVLQDEFPDIHIGYSDHTVGTDACELALAMGCRVIEKHFTDDKEREFRDHALSAHAREMKELIKKAHKVQKLLGKHDKNPVLPVEGEERIAQFRRSVYAKKDLKKGDVLTEENTITLRPKKGIDAVKYFDILGKKLLKDKKIFEALKEDELE